MTPRPFPLDWRRQDGEDPSPERTGRLAGFPPGSGRTICRAALDRNRYAHSYAYTSSRSARRRGGRPSLGGRRGNQPPRWRGVRRGARLKIFPSAIFRKRRMSSARSAAVSGATVRSCALATTGPTDDSRARPLAVISISVARRSCSEGRVETKPRACRFRTTTATVVQSSAATPPIAALSRAPCAASAVSATYCRGVRS